MIHVSLLMDVLIISLRIMMMFYLFFIHAPLESRIRRVKEDYQEVHDDYKKIRY